MKYFPYLKNSIMAFVLALILSLNFAHANSKDIITFDIEKNVIFKTLLDEFEKPGTHLNIYQESESYRFDLTLYDLVDIVSISLEKSKFKQYKKELNHSYRDDAIYFYQWYVKLKELASKDKEFLKYLNKKLYIQLYNKHALALLPEYKLIDFQKIKDLKILNKLKRYNAIVNSPEGKGLADSYSALFLSPFITQKLTVTKLHEISQKKSKKIRKAYFNVYKEIVAKQYKREYQRHSEGDDYISFVSSRKSGIKAKQPTARRKSLKKAIKVFNIIQAVQGKVSLLEFISKKLSSSPLSLAIPKINGHFIMTPLFIEKNWNFIRKQMKAFTYGQLINLNDDEYLLLVRKWIKRNYNSITQDVITYNQNNSTNEDNLKPAITLTFKNKKRIRRLEVLKQYHLLEKLYPHKPWMKKTNPDLIDSRGRARYFNDSFMRKVGRKFKKIFKYLIKLENYTSLITGTALLIVSGGNVALSMSVQSLVKKAIYNLKHDKEWKEFIRTAPMDVISAFLLGSGFTAGRLYHILALGSAQGALQSLLTGQDIRTGALVGAGLNLVRYYILPYSLAKPMTTGFDSSALATNRLYEIIGTTVNSSIQGAVVAGFTGEDPLTGALVGGAYGTVSSILTIWILGTRYHPFKDYTDEELDSMISSENNFQNDVGRGGLYGIDRQMILDSNYRVGGVLPDAISASITLPGNISMSDSGFNSLTTMTHEAHHLMQQHQSGVFGFYLFRYIPTAIRTSYSGHPDENFLSRFLDLYAVN
jgi:hypothetical protein